MQDTRSLKKKGTIQSKQATVRQENIIPGMTGLLVLGTALIKTRSGTNSGTLASPES